MSECIAFDGFIRNGYGRITREGRTWRAHRWVWTQANGEIPLDMDVHHTCLNRACVNLEHLQLVTRDEHQELHHSETCRKCGGSRWDIRMVKGYPSRRCHDCHIREVIESNKRRRRK